VHAVDCTMMNARWFGFDIKSETAYSSVFSFDYYLAPIHPFNMEEIESLWDADWFETDAKDAEEEVDIKLEYHLTTWNTDEEYHATTWNTDEEWHGT
jgi:hypothetical protein